jgi:Zn-dependent protease with chaperone function/tellurite resistance protein
MDFFQAQDHARGQTRLLVVLFAASVLAIIVALHLVFSAVLTVTPASHLAFSGRLFFWIAVATGTVVAGGSAYRTARLRAGGPVVAAMLGARIVPPQTADEAERRLLNVVEEMALASGVPVPHVYVMPYEDGINAFAAGWTIHDAAIAVTRGALDHLDRDELQGVIAHEFSHVLNGDMRLNIRLIGIIFGILQLAVLGRGALHLLGRSSHRGRRGPEVVIPVIGATLVVVGYIGVFFGNVIRAAVSRQREFLADAAAAQFTRNPGALAGALRKIGGLVHGSYVLDYHAEEVRHLFFAEGVFSGFSRVFSTHPPLDARVRKLDPGWDGSYALVRPVPAEARPRQPIPEQLGRMSPAAAGVVLAHLASRRTPIPPPPAPPELRRAARTNVAAVLGAIGAPTAVHIHDAAALLAEIPAPLRAATRDAEAAQALLFALLIRGTSASARNAQREIVRHHGGTDMDQAAEALERMLDAMGDPPRLALLDLSLPALRLLPEPRARAFLAATRRIIVSDGEVHAFEYAVMHILGRQLGSGRRRPVHGDLIHSIVPLRDELTVLLSAVAWTGSRDATAARTGFHAGVQRLPDRLSDLELLPRSAADLPRMDAALGRVEHAALGVRRRVLEACAHAAAGDGGIDAAEGELLRAVAECLDLPVSPAVRTAVPMVPH